MLQDLTNKQVLQSALCNTQLSTSKLLLLGCHFELKHGNATRLLTCLVYVCTGANDQQTVLQQKQKQLEESKQDLARMREVAEPDRL